MKFKTAYGENDRQAAPTGGKSLTEQSHKKACDINSIVANYRKTGLIDHVHNHHADYGDVSGADFKSAQDLIAEQKTVFYELPAAVRAQFDHNPAKYLDLVMTDEGVQQLQNLLNPVEEPEIQEEKEPETGSKDGEQDKTPVT